MLAIRRVQSRGHPFTELHVLNMAPRAAGVYRIRSANKKGHVYLVQTLNLRDRLLEHWRGMSEEAGYILEQGELEFAWESVEDETARRTRELELLTSPGPCATGGRDPALAT